jgi:putative phosphoribosyl transferase
MEMAPLFSRHQDIFHDRIEAGARLADALRPVLEGTPPREIVAVGLARGGVIVAAEVARRLGVRLEAIVVRKLGAPDQPELAIGALAASGERVLNLGLVRDIGLRDEDIDRIAARAARAAHALCEEIGAPPEIPDIDGMTVLLIDDGLATGATMRVAIEAARAQGSGRVIVAIPVAPQSSIGALRRIADEVVAVLTPSNLRSVGQWYRVFGDTPSADVGQALASSRTPPKA